MWWHKYLFFYWQLPIAFWKRMFHSPLAFVGKRICYFHHEQWIITAYILNIYISEHCFMLFVFLVSCKLLPRLHNKLIIRWVITPIQPMCFITLQSERKNWNKSSTTLSGQSGIVDQNYLSKKGWMFNSRLEKLVDVMRYEFSS